MTHYTNLLNDLWKQYSSEIPAARKIHDAFVKEGETVANDHIALRTFNDPRVNIDILRQPFLEAGYVEKGHYDFPNKHLLARHYEHAHDINAPKIFISELICEVFSPWLVNFIKSLIDKIPTATLNNPNALLLSKTPWAPLIYADYKKLLAESEYAAWMYAYGYRANHFTVSVNHLKKFTTLEAVNNFVKSQGFELNAEGGEIKGTPAELLEQSSTRAEKQTVHFEEGDHLIPSCYYEFARRYIQANGQLYQGFIAASADKIFESTHTK